MSLTTIRAGVAFRSDAAASFRRLERQAGRRLDINRTVVPYAEQMDLYRKRQRGEYPYPVAHPDYSNHVYRSDSSGGNAWDTDERGAWLDENGWIADVAGEPWHREYRWWLDRHRFDPEPKPEPEPTPEPEEEEDDMDERITYARDEATKGQGTIYAVDRLKGVKRPVSKGEWSTIRATVAGVKVAEIAKAELDGIPNG